MATGVTAVSADVVAASVVGVVVVLVDVDNVTVLLLVELVPVLVVVATVAASVVSADAYCEGAAIPAPNAMAIIPANIHCLPSLYIL